MNALIVRVGANAATRLQAEGWHPELFDGLVGASGGPKWLILGHLDRAMWRCLLQHRQRPLQAVASSIGAWRHAMLAQPDPIAAIDRFEQAYLDQDYSSSKPSVTEITGVAKQLLATALGPDGEAALAEHPWFHSTIVTARGLGLTGRSGGIGLTFGLAGAALANTIDRRYLARWFQRVLFQHQHLPSKSSPLTDFYSQTVPLYRTNTFDALMASGAIPYVFEGVSNPAFAPPGVYWDGGVLDYHFDVQQFAGTGLWLYPHFSSRITPGWFDKFLPWRAGSGQLTNNMVMLCPSDAFIAQLPHRKIPDRGDFRCLCPDARRDYWRTCVEASKLLAEEFHALVSGADPLAGVTVLPELTHVVE